MKYKGYRGEFEFDEKHALFFGKVSNINDLVTFQAKSKQDLQKAFEDAVNDYIAWCKKYRKETVVSDSDTPCSLYEEKEISGGG